MTTQGAEGLRTAHATFVTATQEFIDSLPDGAKSRFQRVDNPEAMVISIQDYIKLLESQDKSRLLRACTKIDKLGNVLKPYFQVVDIFESSHPDWAGIAWGAVRLVFQLSSHFVTFFERLTDMLQEITASLPNYEAKVDLIRERASESGWRDSHQVLMRSLSYVYVDVLQFCHDSCQLFSKKHKGFRRRVGMITGRFWVPFDQRFSLVLRRLKTHAALFESSLDFVFSEEMLQHFTTMEQEMKENAAHREDDKYNQKLAETKAKERQVCILQTWIGAPNWTDVLDSVQDRRIENSGKWLLETDTYLQWVSQQISNSSCANILAENTLVIIGKPGFGKTVLSAHVIEDLQQRARLEAISVSEAPGDSPLVCYVHFDQQRLRMSSRLAAFQLFAAQILFAKRNNQSFIDAASVLMSDHGTGQRNASANELLALIQVFVKHLTSCYFVVDGLDECSEWEELLRSLKHCIQHSNCQIVIFTRPHIPYHRVIESDAFSLELRGDENIEDIKMFLRGPISELSESGKIGNVSEEYVVTALATQANSIFLWAVLIVAYLQQPGSTPRERLDIINGNISFLGLENLYSRILEDLAGRVPKTHLVKVRKVFQWLIASKEPWTHEMLRTALAVQDNRPSTQGDFITDFTKSMLELCGPLIEFRPDWTIRFIHLSVAEYLTSPNEESQQSGFHLPINIAHCSMANLSLAYLMHEIPRHPLSGNPWITASHNIVSRKHILLPYVAKHWPDHVCRSLEFREGLEEEYKVHMVGRNCLAVLESFLRKLLEDKEVVTAWIEASWTFGTPPSILDLADRAKECSNLDDQRLKGKFISLSETLTRLASSLARLNKDWGHVLVTEPNEIWQPSIAAFSKSQFLVGTTEADLSSLSSDADNGSVVIASQVSCNGKEVGVLKVWPTSLCSSFTGATDSHNSEKEWKVSYQVWSLETKLQIIVFQFQISSTYICGEEVALGQLPEHGFRFPVTFSPSLRVAIILGVVIQISGEEMDPTIYHCNFQQLLDLGCQSCPAYFDVLDNLNMPLYSARILPRQRDVQAAHEHSSNYPICHSWTQRYFHANDRYLAVLSGESNPKSPFECTWIKESGPAWVLDIYKNRGGSRIPSFQLIACVGIKFDSKANRIFCFHPSRPIVAICKATGIIIWRFEDQGSFLVELYHRPLNNMNFSNCGNFIYGTEMHGRNNGNPVFLFVAPVTPFMIQNTNMASSSQGISSQLMRPLKSTPAGFDQIFKTTIENSGMAEFSTFQGLFQISTLNHHGVAGAITRRTIRSDGTVLSEIVTRTPGSLSLEKAYSTIVKTDNDENLRLVLNKAAQESYSALVDVIDIQLPAVLDRKRRTIPVYTGSGEHAVVAAHGKRRLESCVDVDAGGGGGGDGALLKRPRAV